LTKLLFYVIYTNVQEQPAVEKQTPLLEQEEIERRTLLRLGLGAAAGAALYNGPAVLRWAAENGGELYDHLASPESMITQPVPLLEPRENDNPTVRPVARGGSQQIPTQYRRNKQQINLRLGGDTPLFAEHTGQRIILNEFTAAGTGIITTAEGPVEGEQAYCSLFTSRHTDTATTVAVGMSGDMYVYDTGLGQTGGTSGEWVRLLVQDDERALPSHAHSQTNLERIDDTDTKKLLIQDVLEGTNTLQELGYQPWAAIRPTTETPATLTPENMVPGISADSCVKDIAELQAARENGKHYLISEHGDILDLTHLFAKAGETLSLYAQLHYQHIAQEPRPEARVKYSFGSSSNFRYAVDPESLDPATLTDTTFAIMNTTSVAMEGISQRLMVEKSIIGDALNDKWPSGLSPEDLTTNSMAIVGMLELIGKYNLGERLEAPLRQLHINNPTMSSAEMTDAIDAALADIRPQLEVAVAEQAALKIGIRRITEPVRTALPRGIYPLIPVKLRPEDAATPTHINVRSAGINPDNRKVRFTSTHVPAMKPTLDHLLSKVGL
jgi:hypothetical protein